MRAEGGAHADHLTAPLLHDLARLAEDADVREAKGVDALLLVPDDRQGHAVVRQGTQDPPLHRVGVLRLVDEQLRPARPVIGAHLREGQCAVRADFQVREGRDLLFALQLREARQDVREDLPQGQHGPVVGAGGVGGLPEQVAAPREPLQGLQGRDGRLLLRRVPAPADVALP